MLLYRDIEVTLNLILKIRIPEPFNLKIFDGIIIFNSVSNKKISEINKYYQEGLNIPIHFTEYCNDGEIVEQYKNYIQNKLNVNVNSIYHKSDSNIEPKTLFLFSRIPDKNSNTQIFKDIIESSKNYVEIVTNFDLNNDNQDIKITKIELDPKNNIFDILMS